MLNALLEEEKAIVTDIAGTTRDIVEGHIRLEGGLQLNLIDTAGIRTTQDIIEQKGIEKSYQIMEGAQLSSWCWTAVSRCRKKTGGCWRKAPTRPASSSTTRPTWHDRLKEGIAISAAKGDIQPLLDEIHRLFDHHRIALSEPSLANERQIALMRQAHASMASAISALEQGLELELAQIDLQEAYTSLKGKFWEKCIAKI